MGQPWGQWRMQRTEQGEPEEAGAGPDETQRNQAFLLRLSDRLRRLEDPIAILGAAAETLGSHLGVNRCGYAEIDEEETFTVERDWTDGSVKHGIGRRTLKSFGKAVVGQLCRGDTQRISNYLTDPLVGPAQRPAFEEMSIAASITVPLIKGGRFVAMMSLHQSRPRDWTDDEVRLVEEVAERTWAALERARAEARLRASEAQLRLLTDNMAQLAWIADAHGAVYWCNQRWYDYANATLNQLAGHGWIDFVRADAQAALRARLAQAFASGAPVEFTAPLRRADGVYRSFLIRVLAERGPDGRVAHWLGTSTDITEQLEAERRQAFLLELGDRLRAEVDPQAIIAATNQTLGEHLGALRVGYGEIDPTGEWLTFTADWTNGVISNVGTFQLMSFGEAIVSENRAGRTFVMADIASDSRLDSAHVAAFAEWGVKAIVAVPLVKAGRFTAVLSVQSATPRAWTASELQLIEEVADRTWATLERARAEAGLRESQALLAAFMRNAPVGMYLQDEQGRYVMANAGMERIFGRPAADVIGHTAAALFDSEAQPSVATEETHPIVDGPQVMEQHLPGADGGNWTLFIRFPVDLAEQGRRIGGFAIDITEQKRAEAVLARSREALYQSEKLTALGSLLAGVSHELNNPLSVVVGQSLMLEEEAQGTGFAQRSAKIRRAAERCAKIVQTFLAMARQKPPQRAHVDINSVVQSALDLTDYGLRTAGVAVTTSLAPELPPLQADADQLHQVIVNLLINAQQALQDVDHARQLTVATQPGLLPGTVEIEVADNGPGIPVELRRRIFEPFFTTKPQGVGTGFGLSFSLGVIEAHGGTLELIDRGPGAAFLLTLPTATAPTVSHAPDEALTLPIGQGQALVVDDEPEIAEMLAELLERQGYSVQTAGSGAEAKVHLGQRDFDIILSDLRMPDVDGPALYAWIERERPALCRRIGFVTGDTLGPSAVRFLTQSGCPYMEKPFTPQAVRAFVGRLRAASVKAER